MLTRIKTTIELPDDLLIEAKAVAARRRTTLKEMITRSLRREIGVDPCANLPPDSPYEVNELGFLSLRRRDAAITSERIGQLMDDIEDEELREALAVRKDEGR